MNIGMDDGPWDRLLVTMARCDDAVTLDFALVPRAAGSLLASLTFDGMMSQEPDELALPDGVVAVAADADDLTLCRRCRCPTNRSWRIRRDDPQNIDKSWTWLVLMRAKLTRRPQVTTDRSPVPVKPSGRSSPAGR